jgi:hypothetical protein
MEKSLLYAHHQLLLELEHPPYVHHQDMPLPPIPYNFFQTHPFAFWVSAKTSILSWKCTLASLFRASLGIFLAAPN